MERLKLIALDEEDLSVVSAHCQDAVLKSGDIEYYPAEKRVVIGMNRFVWEKVDAAEGFERRRSILHFARVTRLAAMGIDKRRKDTVLALLAVTFSEGEAPSGSIEIVFSGGRGLRLEVECIEAQLADLAAAWTTSSKPSHEA